MGEDEIKKIMFIYQEIERKYEKIGKKRGKMR